MDTLDRIEGLVDLNQLADFKKAVKDITSDLYAEGFERAEIWQYLHMIARSQVASAITTAKSSEDNY